MRTIVYKVGGSLLDLPELPRRIAAVLSQRPGTRPLLIVGGGAAADVVRQWDAIHALGEERAHWLALLSMMLGERLLAALLRDSQIVATRAEAEHTWKSGCVPILCAHEFLRTEEPASGDPLPHTWSVTSDSIAAWITHHWPCDELVLLKSVDLPQADRLKIAPANENLTENAYTQAIAGRALATNGSDVAEGNARVSSSGNGVDSEFAALAKRLVTVRWANLRAGKNPRLVRWTSSD